MKRQISIFAFLLGAFVAVGLAGGLRADETVRAWFVSTGGSWNSSDTTHIAPSSGTLFTLYKDESLSFTALPPPGYQVTRWLWNDNFNLYLKESDMSEITGSVRTRWVSDDLQTCTLLYSGNGQRALGVRFDYIEFEMKYNPNGGQGLMPSPEAKMNYDSTIGLPHCGFFRTGYGMAGWTNAVGKVFADEQSGIKGSEFWNPAITNFSSELFAVWTANVYTVTFDANGGGTPVPASKSVTYDSTYGELATCARDGWQFDGWYTMADGGSKIESGTKVTITENQTLYAHWTQKFKVTFREDSRFGGAVLKEEYVLKGGNATPPQHPVHEGYTSRDWNGYMNVQADKTVTAEYDAESYFVTFHANDGSAKWFQQNFVFGTPGVLPTSPWRRAGYGFEGWGQTPDATKSDCYQPGDPFILPSPEGFDLFAIWKPISYTVAFAANGGEGDMDPVSLTYGTPFTVPECKFAKTGCEFKSWSATVGGVATNFVAGEVVSNLTSKADAEVMFTAEWTGYYTVAFDANGGAGTMTNLTYETDVEYALPSNTFTKTGYRFYGWATSQADADALKTPAYTNEETVVDLADPGETRMLFAEWTTNRYTVGFLPGGAKGTMEDQSFVYDQPQALNPCTFVRGDPELWEFTGWTNSAAGGRFYENGEMVSNLTDVADGRIELTAVWKSTVGPLSEAMGCDNLRWESDEWTVCQTDGLDGIPPCVQQIKGDGVRMSANIMTNGTLTFWYKFVGPDGFIDINLCDRAGKILSLLPKAYSTEWTNESIRIELGATGGAYQPYIEIVNYEGGEVRIDQLTWTPDGAHPEPTDADKVTISSAAVSDGKFTLSFKSDERFDYNLLTNANLLIDNWGVMGTKKVGDGSILKFEPQIIEGQPQLFYRVDTIQRK